MLNQDQVIDRAMAATLQADAARSYLLLAWLVLRDEDLHPGMFIARLVTDSPTPYLLMADTLGGLHAQLPLGLAHSERQPADPPEVVEMWFLR